MKAAQTNNQTVSDYMRNLIKSADTNNDELPAEKIIRLILDTEKRRTEQSENIRGDIQYLSRLLTAIEGQQRVLDKTTTSTLAIQMCNLAIYNDLRDKVVAKHYPDIAEKAKRLAEKK